MSSHKMLCKFDIYCTLIRFKCRKTLHYKIITLIQHCVEGLAVGVGFGAVGKSPSATFEIAKPLISDFICCISYRISLVMLVLTSSCGCSQLSTTEAIACETCCWKSSSSAFHHSTCSLLIRVPTDSVVVKHTTARTTASVYLYLHICNNEIMLLFV